MSSALACVGLAVSDDAEFNLLLKHALTGIREIGTFGGVYVGRWQDDSGAALILGLHDGQIADFTFAYAGTSGGLLADCRLIHQSIAWAKVTDTDGQQVTAMAFEAQQYRQLLALGQQVSGAARITALGIDVTIYPDPDAYTASPDSKVPGTAPGAPPDYDGPWPPRLAAESFVSHAAFADSPDKQSRARLSGTVLNAARHVCAHRAAVHRRRGPHRRIHRRPVPGRRRPPRVASTRQHHQRHRRPVRRHRSRPPELGAGMNGGDPADAQDLQHPRFVRIPASDAPDAQERVMSWSAYDLQVRATAHSAASGQPGFVPDGYLEHLNDLGLQPTITADELCTVGLWERTGGGYRILDREAIELCQDLVRQHNDADQRALAEELEHQDRDRAATAKPVMVTPPCAACGTPSARIELVAPGQLPAQWDHWPSTAQASISRQRQPGQWHLLVTGPAAGNGYGDFVDTARAGQIAWAFRQPLRFAQVHEAGFYDDAGFCPGCDAPYCYRHWQVTESGYGSCPRGHGKSLDPHWSPLARSRRTPSACEAS